MDRISELPDVTVVGAGWLGKPLCLALLENGFKVAGSTTRIQRLEELAASGIRPFLLDIAPSSALNYIPAIALPKSTLVLNIPPKPEPYWADSMLNLCTQARDNHAQIIWISSTSVYGPQPGIITEENPLQPVRPGGKVLAKLDKEILEHFPSATILRPAGLAGPGRHPGRFLAGKKELSGAEEPVNLVHQTDVIRAIIRLMQHPLPGETFNLCSPIHPSRGVFYRQAALSSGLEPPEFLQETSEVEGRGYISGEKVAQALEISYQYADPFDMLK